ncbi:MAG: type I restriction endonuclease subunit R [Dehalococcoidia bacterium]
MTTSDRLNELNHAENPARELLEKLGYRYVPREVLAGEREDERGVLLTGRLTAALMRLNEWMSEDHAQRVIFNLQHIDATGLARNQRIHEYLVYGMPLTIDRAGRQETPTVRFFDFDHPEPGVGLNEYVVTTQFRVRRGNERGSERSDEDDTRVVKPDLVLFVNGIPLVVLEAKSPSLLEVWKTKAVRQLLRYQEAGPEWHGAGAPELFDTNLMCVALCGADAAYAAIGAPENAYSQWKSIEPLTETEFGRRFGIPPEGQARLIVGLLSPPVLLDVLRDFVVFEPERGRLVKKLPRYQQYRAVRHAIARILDGSTPSERGGVVWHTQGSGKSLTMLYLATKLRRSPALRNPTIVVVTDRTQLDTQITRTFRDASVLEPERASDTRQLRELLSTNNGRTVMTTIQKFEEALSAPSGDLAHLNDADNVVVMIDEAHRTQYGRLAAKMRAALQNATFVGFTGTPIDQGFRRTTLGTFGELIDSYTIPQSVEDGATVPIYYEARLPELHVEGPETLDRLFDALFGDEPEETRAEIRRRYANKETIAEAAKRIEAIALDIAEHFRKKVQPNGFKAQVVAPSRAAAVRYADHLVAFGLSAYPIITTTNNDGPEFRRARELDEDQIVNAFTDAEGEPQILVVVDKLITGFDAPVEQVLYLDRSIREHSLLQAIARVNRRYSRTKDGVTTEKTYGLVVDYHGVSRELESALAIFDRGDIEEALTELPEDPGPVIQAAADRAESHFRGLALDDPWACVHRFDADAGTEGDYKADQYESFDRDYRDFSTLMDRFLPEPAALAYLDRLRRLTVIRSYARALFLRERADIDWTAVGAKVKQLLDSRIDASVRELMAPVSVLDQDFEQKIARLPHDEARASVMEHALRAQIKERVAENPVFYERLSEALERIIRELRERLIDAAEGCRRMAVLRSQINREETIAAEHGLTPVSFAVYGLLAGDASGATGTGGSPSSVGEEVEDYRAEFDERLKDVARGVDAILQEHRSIIDWRENLDVQRVMRRDIKRLLRDTGRYAEDELDELVRQVVEIARRRLT